MAEKSSKQILREIDKVSAEAAALDARLRELGELYYKVLEIEKLAAKATKPKAVRSMLTSLGIPAPRSR